MWHFYLTLWPYDIYAFQILFRPFVSQRGIYEYLAHVTLMGLDNMYTNYNTHLHYEHLCQ